MIHIITQFILLINLLQLGYLKSKITFHPFVSLYNNHTLHHLYKKATKTDRENDLTLFENRKTEGCRHANFFQKKLYLHQIILLINLLQLGRLKSQITFHPFVLLYNNYTLHHSYKLTPLYSNLYWFVLNLQVNSTFFLLLNAVTFVKC